MDRNESRVWIGDLVGSEKDGKGGGGWRLSGETGGKEKREGL